MSSDVVSEQSRLLVESVYDAVKRSDVPQILAAFHPDVVLHEPESLPYGGVHEGMEQMMGVLESVITTFDFSTLVVDHVVAHGETVAAQIRLTRREQPGQPAEEMAITEWWTVRDGRAVYLRPFYWDTSRLVAGR